MSNPVFSLGQPVYHARSRSVYHVFAMHEKDGHWFYHLKNPNYYVKPIRKHCTQDELTPMPAGKLTRGISLRCIFERPKPKLEWSSFVERYGKKA